MSVIRAHKTENFTTMSNVHLKDNRLSLKAKGLLSMILALPDSWTYSIRGLASICKEGEKSITSTLAELKSFGYVKVTKIYPQKDSNRIRYEYDIYEVGSKTEDVGANSQDPQNVGLQDVGLQVVGLQSEGLQSGVYIKDLGVSTEVSSTDEVSTDSFCGGASAAPTKREKERKRQKAFVKPTPEEVEEYGRSIGFAIDGERFCDHYEARGWRYNGNLRMVDWKAAVRTWRSNSRDRQSQSQIDFSYMNFGE